ncbi:MAG: DUF2155 domain-containing protein, partial [Alphaproteobacteria bacterium]|nr:DUF2155 domain-containing protein [Alphaproteobacteria bacterium]
NKDNIFEITGEEGAVMEEDVFRITESSTSALSQKAKLVIINKITANSREFLIEKGKKIQYGHAEVQLNKCARTEFGDSLIHVSLREVGLDGMGSLNQTLIFRGWLFAGSPSLSAPSHPIYQLIAISCS